MKKYFAKYLPVEGEINGGEKKLIPSTGVIVTDHNDGKKLNDFLSCKKVKLFLCSRDIQVGDKIKVPSSGFELEVTKDKIEVGKYTLLETALMMINEGVEVFKVIGEISPDALGYVKEGDEFDHDQTDLVGLYPFSEEEKAEVWDTSRREYAQREDEEYGWYHRRKYFFGNNIPKTDKYIVYIKGPCGHFH